MTPEICESCGDAGRRWYRECSRCQTIMLVCKDCLQEHVEVQHESGCDYPDDA